MPRVCGVFGTSWVMLSEAKHLLLHQDESLPLRFAQGFGSFAQGNMCSHRINRSFVVQIH